ncbi:Amidoligase enzyme [Madurella fahalii]|uniref:Amidoligase enzyme n=1 Tax=Madurella fahalii TaxID=1157608 RepID=A0ABQ0FYQ3_9PEZI
MPHFHVADYDHHGGQHWASTYRHVSEPTSSRIEPPEFRFCVELGLVIRSRHRDHKIVTSLQDELSTQLTLAGIPNHIADPDPSASAVSSREWTITSELSIPARPRDHRFGIKLVSPFRRLSRHPHAWQSELGDLLHALHAHFELTTTHQCFTHVHVVPEPGYWTLGQARALAKSALYFEPCLDALVPPYRRRSVWAKSNRNNRYFGALSMAQCFDRIDAQQSFEGLAARMNWCDAASPTGRALRARPGEDFQHDAYRWGFANLNEGAGLGTVEFRQPPGSTSAAEVITWVMLVGCLARLSCGLGGSLEPRHAPKLKSLGEWLVYEAEWCRMPHTSLLKDLLKQAVPVTETPGKIAGMDADVITIDEDQRLRWKAGERNIVVEKYRRLLKHIR